MACWSCGGVPRDRDELPPTPCLSSLHHLLQSNNPPADAEIPVLAEFASIGRCKMDALDAQIKNLTATLNRLISERDDMASQVQQCTAVLAPIRRVPPEIICAIFSWTLPRTKRVAGELPTGAPWYLGQISGIWRQIALGLPSLWNSITVFHTEISSWKDFSPLPMVAAQLIRSANAPLEVDFEWMTYEGEAAPFMDALLTHSHRWRSFRLLCCDSGGLLTLMHPAKGRLAQLDTLEIDDSGREEGGASVASDIFSIAPNLRQVLLTNASFNHYSPALLIPWQQLTQYRGVETVEHLVHILQAASGLVDGALGFTDEEQEIPDGPVITLPHLRRLFTERGDFLARLTAPQLEYLSCDTVRPLVPFVERSSCRLTTLVVIDGSLSSRPPFAPASEDVIMLLRHTPALKNLVLQASEVDEEDNTRVLRALTMTGSSSDICPSLTFFAYGPSTSATLLGDVFVAMIRSRRQPNRVCQLSSLRVFSCPRSDARKLLAAMDQGLDVKFSPSESVQQARYSFVLTQ
ncbi:hypothetical protein DFH06DRAFT_159597 [Mycena polygramma]|nr:hypothetical protein DFH06DRAFT_159597 [Mycena polygramma]